MAKSDKRWKPLPGEIYFFIRSSNGLLGVTSTFKLAEDHPMEWDRQRYNQNNMFKTEEQARRVLRGVLNYIEGEGSE